MQLQWHSLLGSGLCSLSTGSEEGEMKPITEEQQQALIVKLKVIIESYEHVVENTDEEIIYRIALTSLTAEPVGVVNRGRVSDYNEHPDAKVDCTHPQSGWENFQDGFQLYAAPPVSTLRLPDKNELSGWARNHEDSLDWYEAEIRRLNRMP